MPQVKSLQFQIHVLHIILLQELLRRSKVGEGEIEVALLGEGSVFFTQDHSGLGCGDVVDLDVHHAAKYSKIFDKLYNFYTKNLTKCIII